MVPLYKKATKLGASEFSRDGFSLLIDQVRMDFDFRYFSNVAHNNHVKLKLLNSSAVFEYETRVSRKVKRSLHPESKADSDFFEFLIVKTKMRQEILDAKVFSENQKLKLLRYFSRTLQAHKETRVTDILNRLTRWKDEDGSLSHDDCVKLLQPRAELYGAN